MTEFERELNCEHCRRWRHSRKCPLEILAGLLTVAAPLLLIASLAHGHDGGLFPHHPVQPYVLPQPPMPVSRSITCNTIGSGMSGTISSTK